MNPFTNLFITNFCFVSHISQWYTIEHFYVSRKQKTRQYCIFEEKYIKMRCLLSRKWSENIVNQIQVILLTFKGKLTAEARSEWWLAASQSILVTIVQPVEGTYLKWTLHETFHESKGRCRRWMQYLRLY